MTFRLTYSTMFNPPPELHQRFDAALANVRNTLGKNHDHFIDGADVAASMRIDDTSPINTDWVLGKFPVAGQAEVDAAVAAARAALPGWRATPMKERNRILRRVGELIEERVYEISAAVALEVGKNRMEALGEVQETADFFYCYCDDFEKHQGFDHVLPDDPLPDFASHNRSIMKPYGVWAVIAPFNFPFALAGGPVAAALVTGNTVVVKGAPDTPWAVRLLAECLRDAGIPAGVFNYLADPEDSAGPLLVDHPGVNGITFTGSYDVGMQICRKSAEGAFPRPVIAEMGGKNACIVTANGDLDRAALGIMRSAFGLSGQKCSALSRVYVDESVADEFIARLKPVVDAIRIGDPTKPENYIGPVGNAEGYANYKTFVGQLSDGKTTVISGADVLADGELKKGYFCIPTVAEAPLDHPLWNKEMFVPIVMLARVPNKETAMALANDTQLGLTAGFYGDADETQWFFDNIEAGVTYANRPQGATTGAWPGYQPFGGWKGSGNTGKGIASFYYLAQYMREQSQTSVE
ncbi:MAG: aldehyde dehydrogenase family protein [Proteobacteria bacterium]|nr:aldehyde dehydrogenase family protein [Pseudomonadota bacterium]MDA0993595.1 aldehyde dehydrogenase family protein [Pseudomonadota bacterium]